LCLTVGELAGIGGWWAGGGLARPPLPRPLPREGEQGKATAPMLMVGFNRRFAPQVQKIKELLAGVTGPKAW
jgi:hypothetical protein